MFLALAVTYLGGRLSLARAKSSVRAIVPPCRTSCSWACLVSSVPAVMSSKAVVLRRLESRCRKSSRLWLSRDSMVLFADVRAGVP